MVEENTEEYETQKERPCIPTGGRTEVLKECRGLPGEEFSKCAERITCKKPA